MRRGDPRGRFTYERKGLTASALAACGMRDACRCRSPPSRSRDLAPQLAPAIDRALRASVEYAFAHPAASRDYVAAHAKEMDPDVTARHIKLYVNDYTMSLDENAVRRMLEWGEQEGVFPRANPDLPLFV